MNRRDFLKVTSAGAIAGSASGCFGDEAKSTGASLPMTQGEPYASLGSHWTNVFEKLSAHCKPRMSFLNKEYTDPTTWSDKARARLLELLHYAPPTCDPNPKILETVDCGSYIRERIDINTTPDIRVSTYVLVPKNLKEKAPALVALHDHGGFYFWGKEKLVRAEPEHPELTKYKKMLYHGRSIADELAKLGFVVIAPDALHWGERGLYLDNDPPRIKQRIMSDVTADDVQAFNARSWEHEELIGRTALTTGVTWPGITIWDDCRVTDYLMSRPEVDPKRVGCVGLSMGSVRTIYLGALHESVRASVAVCWMAKYQPMAKFHIQNGIGYTKLVPGLYNDLDWPDLAGLHWPGSLMTINGLKDALYPVEAGKDAVAKIEKIFAKMNAPENYKGLFFDGPHEFNVPMQKKAFDWLSRQLQS